ncbi:MAG: hypothetical protein NVSMB32_01630 [Actinomycetota bacterium]
MHHSARKAPAGAAGFEVLGHTADTGFRAWAPSLPALFSTAAEAMFSLEYDPATVPLDRAEEVSVAGDDPESALYAWLSELIWLHDALGFVPGSVRVTAIGASSSGEGVQVAGVARGADIGEWFVQTGAQLKAVTMHGLAVHCAGSASGDDGAGGGVGAGVGCEATVYLDV